MPSFTEYINRKGQLPGHLTFSLASLIAFYNGSEIRNGVLIGNRDGAEYEIKDDKFVLDFFAANSKLPADELAKAVLSNTDFWGTDLAQYEGVLENVGNYISDIRSLGMRKALEKNFG